MIKTFLLASHERAILFENRQPVRWLDAGKHRVWDFGGDATITSFDLDVGYAAMTSELRAVMPQAAGVELVVPHRNIALVTRDGEPHAVLGPGRYVLWQLRAVVRATLVSTEPVLAREVPEAFFARVPPVHMRSVVIAPHERVLLYVDGALAVVLGPGKYGVFCEDRDVLTTRLDLRERELQIVGQEVMTADKVSIRVNLVAKYRITDPVLSVESVQDLNQALYSEAQVVARRSVAGSSVDQLLERRHDTTATMRAELTARAAAWGVEIVQLDLKDVVLPGEMKALLNRVIEAEKQAAASNILRREETAATRSLANTAKLLESNPTLLRMKELETWKEIASNVGQVTIVAGSADLLGRLSLSTPERS